MKTIAIFVDFENPMDYFTKKPEYWNGYKQLYQEIRRQGGDSYLVNQQKTYQGNGVFSQSWTFGEKELEPHGELKVDVIFDKGRFVSDGEVRVYNFDKVKQICTDKWAMYHQLQEYCPATFQVNTLEELQVALPQITTSKAVFKPQHGAEGVGVKIEDKAFFADLSLELDFPGILQDFLDGSAGIPGIVDGTHDFRVAIIDGEIVYSYVRTPPSGSLLANVSKGGTFRMIDVAKIPVAIAETVKKIDQIFSDCPHRFYGVDFAVTPAGPKIIEMNCELGLLPNEDDPVFVTVKQKIAAGLVDM